MASSDATPFPIKNQAYRVTFPILDADGDLVAGATGLDSDISKDGGTFVDCTNEATQIATSSGMYFLDLTNTEMNADTVSIIVKTSSSGAKTTPIVMYPVEDADIPVNVKAIDDDTTAPGILKLQYNGTGLIGDTYPFTQSGGAALGGGISIKTTMVSVTVIQGSQQDLANANTSDDSRWTGDDDASGAEFIFRCTPVSTSSIPVELSFEGYYDEPTGGENGATLQVYNFNTAGWDTIITLSNSNKDEKHQVPLSHAHKAPGGGTLETVAYTIGDVLLKFKQDTTETGNACLLIDYMVVGFVNGLVTAADIQAELEENSASLLDTIRDELANGSDGLTALKSAIDAIPTTAMRGTDSAALASAYTATRAGYLDELAAANLPTDVAAIPTTMVGTNGANTTVPDTAGTASSLHSTTDALINGLNDITVDNILNNEVDNDGTAISFKGFCKLVLAILAGKSSGGGGATIVFRDINDSKNRISATVDANGNRTAIGTRDAS